MELIIAFVVGVLLGCLIFRLITRNEKTVGSLKVNTSDPDGPYLFLELNGPAETTVMNRKYVTMKVDISQ